MKNFVIKSAEILGVSYTVLMEKRKRRGPAGFADARRMICTQLRKRGRTWQDIAELLGCKNHATAKYWHDTHEDFYFTDFDYRQKYDRYNRQITEWEAPKKKVWFDLTADRSPDFGYQDETVFAFV